VLVGVPIFTSCGEYVAEEMASGLFYKSKR
jgi:hypothetical protein